MTTTDPHDMTDLVAVVTGGASGMGEATCRLLAARDAHVIIVDRNGDGASRVAAEIGATKAPAGDVSDSAYCDHIIEQVIADHGRIDILVNAAGTIHRADGLGTTDEQWRRVMGVNVDGIFYMCRAALPHMLGAGSGSIVNFGSIWGDVGSSGALAYCASKGAVHQLTRAMALDCATSGVRVNAVAPGEVNTPMLASERSQPPTAADLEALADATIPMKRLADPREIAEIVVFLASDAASYMTGAVVPVDAGYTAR